MSNYIITILCLILAILTINARNSDAAYCFIIMSGISNILARLRNIERKIDK